MSKQISDDIARDDGTSPTPAMIEAGALELANFNSDYQSFEDAAERIYLAMVAAYPSPCEPANSGECTEAGERPTFDR